MAEELATRYVVEGHIQWRYSIVRRTNQLGDVGYGVYREIPMSVPSMHVKDCTTKDEATEYIAALMSDV